MNTGGPGSKHARGRLISLLWGSNAHSLDSRRPFWAVDSSSMCKLCSLQIKEAAVSHQHLGSNQGACFMMLTQCGLKCGSLLEEEEGKGGELGEGWFTSKLGWDVSLGTSQSLNKQAGGWVSLICIDWDGPFTGIKKGLKKDAKKETGRRRRARS
ncbi:hypothetical protein Naga_100147g7 [Nannochloropsis gaditana]|uniref:Uncharacterized protein n=1 Tax=Nannochloropsis gaditana TaxID=72520 RepID=W7T3G3_9STRA|nr:hypothetical protein Naga_100147g7 [Nannochloropsis gaditana]